MRPAPEVALIQDLSGFGRCSTTVALPTLAAMGARCETLLTAYLSAHTGFPRSEHSVFLDLTDQMERCCDHWAELGASFDAVYSGFLGSARQIDLLRSFIHRFRRPDTLVLVDPVMGDDGRPYSTYTPDLCARMGSLAEEADLITPNLTEAAILLGEDYSAVPADEAGMSRWLERLSLDGKRSVVITGVSLSPDQVGAGCWDRESGRISFFQANSEPAHFSGTGDLFASILLGGMLRGESLPVCTERAVRFVQRCAAATLAMGAPISRGVQFEPMLHELMEP
ncbi:pyridoxamine kinase [Pseudoflavonifractor sp. MSJ-37]|uniref:pyridoxamine kinase n=1 Tax=Pseudoflavonifractor sp. MSJ-37 TaxID=2841531 RepID=UPI001C11976F|nr:pyridoxamine kinase [Pseudoflavonifractor sp. MSJ-37]MBU5435123.1 pyridoxamine kinase [Pseudoflavonifractor sp. MSJ-37]